MKNTLKLAVIAVVIAFGSLVFVLNRPAAQTQTPPAAQGPTIGQQFKNIKVLNDVPADQLGKIMNLFNASLGVDCSFCHNTKDFTSDEKREKQTARHMIQMTFDINKANFGGRSQVSCNTCHNGHQGPSAAPNLWPSSDEAEIKQPDTKPTSDQILANYEAAVGGKDRLAKITSRHITANRVEADGKSEPEDIWQQGQKLRIATTYATPSNIIISAGFNGTDAWEASSGQPIHPRADELDRVKTTAQILFNPDLRTLYTKLEYRFTDEIDGKPVYLVTATMANNQVDRLTFDAATGLLLRRTSVLRTALGPFVYQWDFADYKDFGGVKIPTTLKYAQPGVRFTRQITKVKINAPITDASIFNEPKK